MHGQRTCLSGEVGERAEVVRLKLVVIVQECDPRVPSQMDPYIEEPGQMWIHKRSIALTARRDSTTWLDSQRA